MIEENAIASVHAVGLPVVDHDPVGVQLGDTIGTAGVEGSRLALGSLNDFSVELRSRCLIESNVFLKTDGTDGVEETESAETVNITWLRSRACQDWQSRLRSKDLGGYGACDGRTRIL